MHKQESERTRESGRSPAAGFSLVELLISMTITLLLMGLAIALLSSSFNVRGRQNQKSSALADAQRALNNMSREIANSGFGLSDNGIVTTESGSSSIRVRANLNAFDREMTSNSVVDSDEDVLYNLFSDSTQSYVERIDINSGARTTVLDHRVVGDRRRRCERRNTSVLCGGSGNAGDPRRASRKCRAQSIVRYLIVNC